MWTKRRSYFGSSLRPYPRGFLKERFLCVMQAADQSFFLIDLSTGIRTEILTLHKRQIDFIRGSIEVKETKNGRPHSVPMHLGLRPILQRLVEKAGPNEYLFENPKTGKPIRYVKAAWRTALRDAKMEGLCFYDLQHTFGTRAIDGGAPLNAVKETMGYMDIRTTMRYVHATDKSKRRAVEAAARGTVKLESVTHAGSNRMRCSRKCG